MQHDPKLKLVETLTSARTYHFQSTELLGGWALCTVNDATGELLIMSDWGNWAHRWSPKHLGSTSLTHFIADRQGYDYLACKLLAHDDAWVLDADATIKKWRKRLCEQRLAVGRAGDDHLPRGLSHHLAREIWEDLSSLVDDERHEPIFVEHAVRIEGFSRWISEEPWEDTVHCHSHAYRLLIDFLLPALVAACVETVRSQAA
jgi:hypothetical protein